MPGNPVKYSWEIIILKITGKQSWQGYSQESKKQTDNWADRKASQRYRLTQ